MKIRLNIPAWFGIGGVALLLVAAVAGLFWSRPAFLFSPTPTWTLPLGEGNIINSLAFSKDSRLLAGGGEGSVWIW